MTSRVFTISPSQESEETQSAALVKLGLTAGRIRGESSRVGWDHNRSQAVTDRNGERSGTLTFHRLLQEFCDLIHVLGVQGGGKDKLALRLHEILPEQLPASGKWLTYQRLRGRQERKGRHCGKKEKSPQNRELRKAWRGENQLR